MRQARARDQATARLAGVIHGGQYPPVRTAFVNRVIVQSLFGKLPLDDLAQANARRDCGIRQGEHGWRFSEQPEAMIVDQRDTPSLR
jgi:hypothetical protein